MKTKLNLMAITGIFYLLLTQSALASFADVTNSTTYAEAINYVQQKGIVSGYPDGTYKPDQQINRAEFTKIIIGATLDYNPAVDSNPGIFSFSGLAFSDLSIGAWYIPYLKKAVVNKVISGYPDGTFRPANNIAFVEAAKIIVGGFNYSVQPDNSIWYKPYVDKMADLKATPSSVTRFDKQITRAEMAEMIYRIQNNITNLNSKSYQDLAGSNNSQTPKIIASGNAPKIGVCQIYPADNAWNRDVSADPVDPNSEKYIQSMNGSGHLHPDFGGNGKYGIPFNVVKSGQALVPINITDYPEESDAGPYPIPADAKVENGSDGHVLTLDQDNCVLYELYVAIKTATGWDAAQASKFDLKSNALRPDYWTSADAAGLPIMPGLAKYDEVEAGAVNHALRFTASKTQKGFIHPATHYASSSTDANLPPMGLRLRLKADFDTSKFTGESKVILEGLKKYGMILADNGSNWYITGAADPRWNDEDLNQMKTVPASAFEAVQSGVIIK